MVERAVGYARFSTQKQEGGFSIESQEQEIKGMALRKGWQYLRTYKDEAVSGATPPRLRPALDELLQHARQKRFDIVICFDSSRMARDQRIFWNIIGELKDLGITYVTYVLPDIDSDHDMFPTIGGMTVGMGSTERLVVSRKTKVAMKILKEQGKARSRPMFGFFINEQGYFKPDKLGIEALELLAVNPKATPKDLWALEPEIPYYKIWSLLKNAKLYENHHY